MIELPAKVVMVNAPGSEELKRNRKVPGLRSAETLASASSRVIIP